MDSLFLIGCAQLRHLCTEHVATLLAKSLPHDWLEKESVLWYPDVNGCNHPAEDWLELVWGYFRKNFPTAVELRRFEGLPLIPLGMSQVPVTLTRLVQPSKIVVRSLHGDGLDEILTGALKKLGLVIVQEFPHFVSLHPATVNTFVHPPSPQGVLKALVASQSLTMTNVISLTDEDKRSLRNFFSKVISLEPQEKQLLCRLPLFETNAKSFVAKESGLCAAPEGYFPVAPRGDLIDVEDDDSKRLAHLLDIRILTPAEFVIEELFPGIKGGAYSGEEIDSLMAFAIERYQVYAGADTRFAQEMKALPFVPTIGGRVRAMDLFNPRNDLTQGIFADEDVFPVGAQYTDPAVLVVLEKLGMKSQDKITAQNLFQSAKKIPDISSISTARTKSEALLSYLYSNPMKLQENLSGTALVFLLQDIPWIYPLRQKPHGFPGSVLFWGETEKEACFFKPTDIKSNDKVNLIGSVKPIIQVDSSTQLAKSFDWDKIPDLLDVVEQLKSVVSCYTQEEKPHYITIIKDIYSYLSGAEDPVGIKEALQKIEDSRWIWNGDGFSSPNVVLAEKPSIDLSPYICSLPSEVMHFSNFFLTFGMQEHCDASFLLQVLHMIKQKYDTGCGFPASEVKKDLQLSVDILNEVKPSVGEQLPAELQEKVLIPTHVEGDSYVKLASVEDCVYCEHEWLEGDNHEEMSFFYVHPNIPNSTAELLLVRSLTNRMLQPDEMPLGDEFGQEEKLTRRLNQLLEDYTDGFAVPKELIQNADDAGATEVRFLYDERTNEDSMTCLIDEGMRSCQGPALWVYNDAEFRDEDFANITKLNGGTKEQETEKIGKFGLGFNAVYNLTDVPMFLSRNYFVIFDPNTFYLGKAIRNKTKPGIKLDVNRKELRRYRNQFKPFNGIFGCDLLLNKEDNSFQGTLFRFPLRTIEQALKSEIKQVHYDCNQMRDLLEIFVSGARTLLLFTQNVRSVSIFHVPSEQAQPRLIFEVNKSLSEAGIIRELSVPVTLQLDLKKLNEDDQYFLKQCNVLRASSEVTKGGGSACGPTSDLLNSALTIDIKSTVTECGSSFFRDKGHLQGVSETWLIASSMGKGPAMQYSRNEKSLLPSGGVAVQLKRTECEKYVPVAVFDQISGEKPHDNGTVFCYLPLPIHSGLPVHVNGAFAVASNRRNLKEKTEHDKDCVGLEWNNILLTDSVCAAYLDLLEDLKSAAEMYSFHLLWPKAGDVRPNCEPLARSFYQKVADGSHGHSLFSDGNRWVDINQVVFLDPDFRQDAKIGDISFTIFQMLIEGNETVIDLPNDVFQSFVKYGLQAKIQSKVYNKERFFRELFFPKIASIPPELRDNLVLYALDDRNKELDELMKKHACIPVSPRGQTLKFPNQLVNPKKEAASLFIDEDERFPFGNEDTFLNSLRLAKLEQLGMIAEEPPWYVIAERAESVSILHMKNCEAALKRADALIHHLARKLNSGNERPFSEGVQERLIQAAFLPVAEKPKKFPLPWKGCVVREKKEILISPKEAFPERQKYLVCCSEPIVDLFIPAPVQTFIGFDRKPATIEHVVTQLYVASSSNTDSMDFSEFEEVKAVCLAAYRYLQTSLNDGNIGEKQATEIFLDKKFILTGRDFVDTNHIAFELAVDCSPYLRKLPDDLAKPFHRLMKTVGVKKAFERKHFISSLEKIRRKFGDTQLDEKELQIAVNMANKLSECLRDPGDEVSRAQEGREVIFLPDWQGRMRLVSELCIKDCYWLPDETDVYYANFMIPLPTCIKLGVKTRREEALQRFAVGISFGQKEKLTNRLKRILSAYPCEKEILKELLQNADDAEATEICFIKDPRQHHDERVFEDSWKPLQGPALCVYNNKPFTVADIEGIQNLGEGSKGEDPNKTGQYGVGFNAVYHLTDVPSFVSSGEEIGDVLCVFDPHCKYVPGANQGAPGRMFREATKLKGMFPDVFSCYIEEHFPSRNSTMFRFPLRTQEMANESKISNTPVTLEEMEEMMEALKGELFEVLLFVNSVKKITLCDIDESGKVVNSYFVEAEMTDEDFAARQQFATCVKEIAKSREGNVSPTDAEVKKCSYVLNLRDSAGNEQRWLIVQQIGFENKVETSIVDAYRKQDLGMLPRGGVACSLENRSERKKKAYCFLPLPIETDLPVHINGHFALDHEARRNLWRDETGGYRSDWNNALLKDVIASCYITLLDKVRSFHQLPALQNTEQVTLGCKMDALVNNIADYEKRFPSLISGDPYWKTLVTSVYQEMDRKSLRLFPVIRDEALVDSTSIVQLTWLPPTGDGKDKAFFNNLEMADCFRASKPRSFDVRRNPEEEENRKRTSFEHILLQTGFNLVAFTMSVYKALEESGVKPCCVSPSAVMEFYKSFSSENPLCRVGPINIDVRDTPFKNHQTIELVLKYCKDDINFLTNLPGIPLLLTQDNYLRIFSAQDPKFLSRHSDILPECKEMFVHGHIRTQIFGDSKSPKASVFKHFDVQSFAANLHRTLPIEYCRSEGYVRWFPTQTGYPNRDWVYEVWKFLSEETSNIVKASEEEKIKCIQASSTSEQEKNRIIRAIRANEEEKTRTILASIEPLNNWSILPCTETIPSRDGSSSGVVTEHFLVPLRLAKTVIYFTYDGTTGPLVEVLRVLSLAELNIVVISTTGASTYPYMDSCVLACKLVASLKTPTSLLTSLKQKMTEKPNALEGKLNPPQCCRVLEYFSGNVTHLQESDKSTLTRLPFYEAAHGGLVSVNGHKVCVVPIEIPRNGMDVLENHVDVVFLKSRSRLSSLFNFLAFESVSTVDVYCKFILKYFYRFTKEAIVGHLEYIRDSIMSKESTEKSEKEKLLVCLRNTALIPGKYGNLKRASCYYDPQNKVFQTMLSEERFPPVPFNSAKWLTFLKTIGLVQEVSQDLFRKFAMEVAREGATQRTVKTDQKSKVLVAHLFTREKGLEESLLQAVCEISFVATDPVNPALREIHQQYGERSNGQLPFIPFKGSVLPKHSETVWTTAAILPHWANPKKYQEQTLDWESSSYLCNAILSNLQVLTEPTVDLGTFHCQNVCFQLEKENDTCLSSVQLSTRMSVMTKIYRFLQEKALSNTVTKERLKHTPCVLVEQGKRVVKAEQVAIELYKDLEIEPFLYRMPAELSEFKTLFQYLGSSPCAKPFHYAMVLNMLQKKCKGNRLNPNEKACVLRAVKGLFEALQENPDDHRDLSSLYLPATYSFGDSSKETTLPVILVEAARLLFDDAPFFDGRISNFQELFLIDLKRADVRCNTSTNFKDLIMFLPTALRPQMLSSVVEEKFADSRDNTERFDFGTASSLKTRLQSEQFYRGIIRLIRHACRENQEDVDESVVASLGSRLQSIQFHGMSTIVTHLVYKGNAIQGSESEVPYFSEKICQGVQEIWNVYVNAVEDAEDTTSALTLALSQVIAEACRGLLRETTMYIPQMLHRQPGKICSFLDRMKIRQDDSYDARKGNFFPLPGSFIPIAEHHLLNPALKSFKPGEYVGYELEDPSLQLEEGDATFIYAVIIEEVSSDDASIFAKLYKINIGHDKEPEVVHATELYKFFRPEEILSNAVVPSDRHENFQSSTAKQAIFAEISRTLEDAWQLDEDRKRQVIKRLILQWHPDKNPGNEEFCTEVFQHIMNEIERLEKGGSAGHERQGSGSGQFQGRYGSFYGFWGARSRRYSSHRQQYRDAYNRHCGSWDRGTRTWEVPPSFCSTNPQPREARRWFRQAEADLAAVANDTDTRNASYEWACLKCHQVITSTIKSTWSKLSPFSRHLP